MRRQLLACAHLTRKIRELAREHRHNEISKVVEQALAWPNTSMKFTLLAFAGAMSANKKLVLDSIDLFAEKPPINWRPFGEHLVRCVKLAKNLRPDINGQRPDSDE